MKRQKPGIGVLFLVPLPDNTLVPSQVIGRESAVLNSWTCAFSSQRIGAKELPPGNFKPEDTISIQFVTGDLFKKGVWPIYGRSEVSIPKRLFPQENLRSKGWVGAKMIGSGNVRSFLAAYHGLEFWDGMKDPDYYQKLLLPGITIPSQVKKRLTISHTKEENRE